MLIFADKLTFNFIFDHKLFLFSNSYMNLMLIEVIIFLNYLIDFLPDSRK